MTPTADGRAMGAVPTGHVTRRLSRLDEASGHRYPARGLRVTIAVAISERPLWPPTRKLAPCFGSGGQEGSGGRYRPTTPRTRQTTIVFPSLLGIFVETFALTSHCCSVLEAIRSRSLLLAVATVHHDLLPPSPRRSLFRNFASGVRRIREYPCTVLRHWNYRRRSNFGLSGTARCGPGAETINTSGHLGPSGKLTWTFQGQPSEPTLKPTFVVYRMNHGIPGVAPWSRRPCITVKKKRDRYAGVRERGTATVKVHVLDEESASIITHILTGSEVNTEITSRRHTSVGSTPHGHQMRNYRLVKMSLFRREVVPRSGVGSGKNAGACGSRAIISLTAFDKKNLVVRRIRSCLDVAQFFEFRWKWKSWKDASKGVSVEKEVSMEEEKDEWEMAPRSLKRVRKTECEEIMLKNKDLWNK
ncbi:hypothetical protein GEV33_006400 [Tenebrio molitor]|uniref:Uncharacterized protein n=1 Tax=Tenebrio molitor TaxID=7067 RepID=A0A8J6HJZ5_TENMO|nr:hypothetical protein GEV33_006400 [Tenebrio molitor]